MRRAAAAVRAGLAGAAGGGLLLAGCGIPATGVVEAGEPAVGVHREVRLYFVRDSEHPSLVVVSRRLDTSAAFGEAVTLLFKGPSPPESKIFGLTTQLPAAPVKAGYADGTVTVDVGFPGGKLSPLAVDQIVCTAMAEAAAFPGRAPYTVTVSAGGTPLHGAPGEAARCAGAADPAPVTSPRGKSLGAAVPQG